jgi:hypothetical protein
MTSKNSPEQGTISVHTESLFSMIEKGLNCDNPLCHPFKGTGSRAQISTCKRKEGPLGFGSSVIIRTSAIADVTDDG